MTSLSLGEYVSEQLRNLCGAIGFEDLGDAPVDLLRELLGGTAERRLLEPPPWPSDVSDDATPVEFSIAFDDSGERAVRVLGETVGEPPGNAANAHLAQQLLAGLADRYELLLGRLEAVQDLFLPEQPQGRFALWCSLIFRLHSAPKFKVYFNPSARGPAQASQLVAEGLNRLGLDFAYQTAAEHALLRGDLDRFTYFAIDLDDSSRSRVKIYVSHYAAESAVVERAAGAVPGIDPRRIRDFCSLMSGAENKPFTGLPMFSSYSFVESDTDHPSNYSIYFPIRDHVVNDESARIRLALLLEEHGIDPAEMDRVLDAVSRRPLRDGVGLIAYVSLRLGQGSGITVYLSSEAYDVMPPRADPALADTMCRS